MICCYCHQEIIKGDQYIYLWQPSLQQYGPVHKVHIEANPKKGAET